jgi:hypothetical protein
MSAAGGLQVYACCQSVATALSIENGLADSLSARPFLLF